ncbi:MAG: flagellinolysin [Lachnospiraceae bacterium]|nr:flagellinolysin [Lachnospiraceae bacterium]
MFSVQHNLAAMNSNRQLGITTKSTKVSTERLSSGYRINRAADDAAGLTISEKMRSQIRGLTQASANAQDGISLIQVAEGALNEVHDMLQRSNELAIKAANGTLTEADRAAIDSELQELKDEIDRTAQHTEFNTLKLFPDNGRSPKSASVMETYHYEVVYNLNDNTVSVGASPNSANAVGRSTDDQISTGSVLADKIANEFVPNAVKQILDAFPSLKNAVGSDTINMALDVSFLDGPNNTLAYAQYTYKTNSGQVTSMLLKVDVSDFDDKDALGTGKRAEALESTLAHELMHSAMQYTMPKLMNGKSGSLPTWFVEGTAQLAGGGFPTGWNDSLSSLAKGLADENDNHLDSNISKYLKSHTVTGRPYGHGYLAAAYAGYLANGGGDVTGSNIAAGMDKIFEDLLNGKSLNAALQHNTGLSESQLRSRIDNANADLVEFVRKLSVASLGGAGSVITPSLATGGTDILGDSATVQPFRIDPNKVFVDLESGGAKISLHIGAAAEHYMELDLFQMDSKALGIENTDMTTQNSARESIEVFRQAIGYVSAVRSYFGASQNRLEHTIANLDNVVENTTAAESRIRDTDMAEEMVRFSNRQILLQAGQSMLAQANQQPNMILSLLG